jgi:hypothetical protein
VRCVSLTLWMRGDAMAIHPMSAHALLMHLLPVRLLPVHLLPVHLLPMHLLPVQRYCRGRGGVGEPFRPGGCSGPAAGVGGVV